MKYVNWYEYMKNPYEEQKESVVNEIKEEHYKWKDLITDNIFYITKKMMKEITDVVSNYILQLLKDNRYEEFFKYITGSVDKYEFINSDKSKDAHKLWIFTELPYMFSEEGSGRISDYLSMRTGILYAVAGCKDKDKVRRISYLYGAKEYLNDEYASYVEKLLEKEENIDFFIKTIEEIDFIFSNEDIGEDAKEILGKYKVDLVKGGVVKVKEFFLETNKIREIRGASILLDNINRKEIPRYIENKFLKEAIVYAGGGNILIVIEAGKGDEVAKEIEKIYEEITVTAQNVAVATTISLLDISSELYKKTIAVVQDNLNERQMSKIDFRTKNFSGNINYLSEVVDYDKVCKTYHGKEQLCESCNMRLAQYSFSKYDNSKLCISCLHKSLIGGREAKESFKKDFYDYVNNNNIEIEDKKVDNLSDIKSDGTNSIGVIYGDGNNMGAVIKKVENILQMKYFSYKTETAIFEAVYGALGEKLSHYNFEIIALGGDDIFMIVPGELSLSIAKRIGERFDRVFKNYSEDKYTITMSSGITIAKYNKPVQYLFDMSMQLLKEAKKKSRVVEKGTIDFLILETDAAFASNVKFIRKKLKVNEGEKIKNCTLRPYTYKELQQFEDGIKLLKEFSNTNGGGFRGNAYNFLNITLESSIEEGNLYYGYQRARAGKKKKELLDNLSNIFNEDCYDRLVKHLYYQKDKNNQYYSIWLDIVEMWDYV